MSTTAKTDVLVRVEGVSKKFCRGLRRSLWYGVQDIAADLIGGGGCKSELRQDEFWAVNDVSFELRRGECLGLIGGNGAGKTTLLKMLNGLVKPDRGRIEMRGRVGALIALGAGFNPILTGRENIYVNGAVLGLSKREVDEKIDDIVGFAETGEFIDAPVQSYSSGMQVRLGFAVARAINPDILLLDEVLAVGDVSFQAKCFNTLAELRARGTCFILVTHNMHMISRYSQRVLYLNQGTIKHVGDAETAVAHYLSDLKKIASDEESATDWSKTYGSGKVKFLRAKFINSRGCQVTELDVGESVILRIEFQRGEEVIINPVLDVIIRDHEGIVYQGSNKICGVSFGELPEEGILSIRFDCLQVNVEHLDFSFALMEASTSEVLDWKRSLRLKIQSKAKHHGRLIIPTQWTLAQHIASESPHWHPDNH